MLSLEKIQVQLDALTAGVNSLLEGQQKLLDQQGKNQLKAELAHGTVLQKIKDSFDAIAESQGEMNRSLNDGFEAVLKSKSKPRKAAKRKRR